MEKPLLGYWQWFFNVTLYKKGKYFVIALYAAEYMFLLNFS